MGTGKAFDFLAAAWREKKPRRTGMTEARDKGMGLNHLSDLCATAADYIDIMKMSGGNQRLLPRELVRQKIAVCKEHGIQVSTGGLLERVVLQGPKAVRMFLEEAVELGYSYVEVSSGMLIIPLEHKLELIRLVTEYGLKAQPEVSQAYGIRPDQPVSINENMLVNEIQRCREAGAAIVLVESEGITQNVPEINEDVVCKIASSCGLKDVMFEAADVYVFNWYVKRFGPEINLFVDETQVLALEALREGIWGRDQTWGRVGGFAREQLQE